jgi:hypothetical protein
MLRQKSSKTRKKSLKNENQLISPEFVTFELISFKSTTNVFVVIFVSLLLLFFYFFVLFNLERTDRTHDKAATCPILVGGGERWHGGCKPSFCERPSNKIDTSHFSLTCDP